MLAKDCNAAARGKGEDCWVSALPRSWLGHQPDAGLPPCQPRDPCCPLSPAWGPPAVPCPGSPDALLLCREVRCGLCHQPGGRRMLQAVAGSCLVRGGPALWSHTHFLAQELSELKRVGFFFVLHIWFMSMCCKTPPSMEGAHAAENHMRRTLGGSSWEKGTTSVPSRARHVSVLTWHPLRCSTPWPRCPQTAPRR